MKDEDGEPSETRWRLIEQIYHSALSRVGTERSTFVAEMCAGDAGLQEELLSLLAADDVAGDFLRAPVSELAFEVLADNALSGADSTAADLVDQVIDGRYEIVELLGAGGFGDVYRAHDKKLLRSVVVKVLKEASLRNPWIVAKFKQEIEALTKIVDPGVVGIFDAGELPDGEPYLVMELVEGVNLRQLMKGARLGLIEIGEIVRQSGRALSAAHDLGIIHRDLKPENIMIRRNASDDLQVKIIDFGIAKVTNSTISSSTETGFVAGTADYMSPEQLLNKKVIPASDIFAFGIVAYEMVTGCRPFNPETRAQLHELQRAGVGVSPKALRPALPTTAERVILQALSYHPTDRWQRARDFGDELARTILENTEDPSVEPRLASVLAAEESTLEKDQSSKLAPAPPTYNSWLRSRWPLMAAAVVVVGLLTVAAWNFINPQVQPSVPVQAELKTTVGPERTLNYWFRVKSLKSKDWVVSTGTEAFFTGESFHFVTKPEQDGALYVFDRGKLADGSVGWATLFPTEINHQGNSHLQANQEISTVEPNTFEGTAGSEEMVIIWAEKSVDWLERIIAESGQLKNNYAVSKDGQERLQAFLKTTPLAESIVDEETTQVRIKGRGEVIVSVRMLSHKPRK